MNSQEGPIKKLDRIKNRPNYRHITLEENAREYEFVLDDPGLAAIVDTAYSAKFSVKLESQETTTSVFHARIQLETVSAAADKMPENTMAQSETFTGKVRILDYQNTDYRFEVAVTNPNDAGDQVFCSSFDDEGVAFAKQLGSHMRQNIYVVIQYLEKGGSNILLSAVPY